MSAEALTHLFYLLMFVFLGAMVSLGAVFALHFFVPKKLLEEYFRPPYFREGEVLVFTGFPFGYIRTVMFMRLAAFPGGGKKRGLTEVYHLAPAWFRQLSRVILALFISFSVLIFTLLLFFYFYDLLFG